MMNKERILLTGLILSMGFILMSCAGMQTKPTEANFKSPTIALELVQVPSYFTYWYYDAKATPLKGKPGANSAVLPVAFLFNITNPNDYLIKLDGFVFTVTFEDIDINIVNAYETQWIPSGKTNQISTVLIVDVQQVLGGLSVANYEKVKAKNTTPWALLEKWWIEIPNMTVPIDVKRGAATFTADGVEKIVPFTFKYPK